MTSIKAIPTDFVELNALSYRWDALMANKFFSNYMLGWITGGLKELDIAHYLEFFYGDKWNRLYDIMKEEYDSLYNYYIEEKLTGEESEETTSSSEATSGEEGSDSGSKDNSIYGYNSGVASDDSKESTSNSYSNTNESSISGSITRGKEHGYTLTRKGNTGNDPQEFLKKEWEVRKNLVLDEIYKDISKELTLDIYDFNENIENLF